MTIPLERDMSKLASVEELRSHSVRVASAASTQVSHSCHFSRSERGLVGEPVCLNEVNEVEMCRSFGGYAR